MTDKNIYGHNYFNGGNSDGSGYKGVGYQNFPVQLLVLDKILERKPESLLDIGGARGYISKMFEQATGNPGWCMDISEYCLATRVTNKFILGDITNMENFMYPVEILPLNECGTLHKKIDLVFSIAVFEHIKEEDLPFVIKRISTIAKRGLICPSFVDVGEPDHTHESLKPKEWWEEQFKKYAPDWPVEIIDKEEMGHGDLKFKLPKIIKANNQNWVLAGRFVDEDFETLKGNNDRKILLNIGSYVVMFRSTKDVCVVNTDVPELATFRSNGGLSTFCQQWGSNFTSYKAPERIPVKENSIDEINCSHMLEHLNREEAKKFLQECYRVLKNNGSIRITVPDLRVLCKHYLGIDGISDQDYKIKEHGIYNVEVEKSEDEAQALWHMITSGGEHKTAYDSFALELKLRRIGFVTVNNSYFNSNIKEAQLIHKIGYDMYPESSLYMVGVKWEKKSIRNV